MATSPLVGRSRRPGWRDLLVLLGVAGLAPAEVRERASRAIRLVGLVGFEEAHPRELSGGMKQRVGLARALSVDPEILFMDEPFSQVDALTAESLRAELLDIWVAKNRNPRSILLVSHDIKEVVYMADRVIVLSANPGRVRSVVENPLPRPRDYRSPEFLALVDRIHEIITGHELPDVPVSAPPPAPAVEPLPHASPAEIVGLLEYLDARGGAQELFRIAVDTNQEFGRVIAVTKAAEMLNFVDTPKRMVLLDVEGKRFVKAGPDQQKEIWREQLLKLPLFREILDLIRREPDQRIDRDLLLDIFVLGMPYEDPELMFDTMAAWARYGDLFAYDETAEKLWLQESAPLAAATGP